MSAPLDHRARDLESLARIFSYFGRVETPKLDSQIYTDYSLGVAEDAALLALAAQVMPSQPPPNVLYAAAQDLLLEDPDRSDEARGLARFYPSISRAEIPHESAFPSFRAFCLAHAEALGPRLQRGRTQTCVVHRSAILLPAIGSLPRVAAAEGAVGLLEIGPSAGLNLRLDRYGYVYEGEGDRLEWGADGATPSLSCALRGSGALPLPERLQVVARRGLELAPLDLADAAVLRWLRALIWPEHVERARVMDEALEIASRVPATVEAGDATRDLEAAVARLPRTVPRVVFATHVVYQIPPEGRREMMAALARASADAPLDLIVMDSNQRGESRIDWVPFAEGRRAERVVLGHADSHGRWIEWGRSA